jgi:hypothetical protein
MSSAKSFAVVLALASTLCVPYAAQAAEPSISPVPDDVRIVQPPTGSVAHTFKSLYETRATNVGLALPQTTYTAIDPLTTIKCAAVAGCTVIAENVATVSESVAYMFWAFCVRVDGVMMTDSCYWQTASNVGSIRGSDRASLHVATGVHTVQTSIYVTNPATLWEYHNDYIVVAP